MTTRGERDGTHPGANPYKAPTANLADGSGESRGWFGGTRPTPRRPPPANQFPVDCECGRMKLVAASAAGSNVECDCGQAIKVPSLGVLRQLSGKAAYESGISDTIRRKIEAGELPAGDVCVVSGNPTDDTLDVQIVLPRLSFSRENPDRAAGIMLLFLGLGGLLLMAMSRRSSFHEQDSTVLRVPLRVAATHHGRVRGMSRRRLCRLLREVPEYQSLLSENPQARVSVADGLS